MSFFLFVVHYKSKAGAKRVYRNVCRYDERLNAETGGSKTPRIYWVAYSFFLSCSRMAGIYFRGTGKILNEAMFCRKCVMLMMVFLFVRKAGAWRGLAPLEAMRAGGARCLASPALRFSFCGSERTRGAHVNARMSGKGSNSEGKGRSLRIFCADKLEETALASMRSAGHKVIYQPEIEGEKLVVSASSLMPTMSNLE
jgi:hypothetical protein